MSRFIRVIVRYLAHDNTRQQRRIDALVAENQRLRKRITEAEAACARHAASVSQLTNLLAGEAFRLKQQSGCYSHCPVGKLKGGSYRGFTGGEAE